MTQAVLERQNLTQEANLPNGWTTTVLQEIVLPIRSKIQPSKDSTLPFIGMDSIEPHSLTVSSFGQFSDMKSSGVHFLPGDVLYGKMRPYLNKVYKAECEGACSAEFLVFPKHNNLDSDFLKYLLHQRDFVNFASPKSSGDRPRIDLSDIADYQVLLPPLNEQKRIVSKIEELFSQLDDGEAALKRAQKLVAQYRQSVLKAAVTGALTKDWREKHQGELETGEALLQRILNARREAWEQAELAKLQAKRKAPKDDSWKKKYPEPKTPDTANLPELPEGWMWASMEALIVSSQNGLSKRRGDAGKEVIVLRLADIKEGKVSSDNYRKIICTETEIRDYSLATSDFLCIRVNGSKSLVGSLIPVGDNLEAPLYCDHFIRLKAVSILELGYLTIFSSTRHYRDYVESVIVSSAGQNTINQGSLMKALIPLPPIEEQKVICEFTRQAFSQVDKLDEWLNAEAYRSKSLRQSILKAAFSGQLVPQDPNDEPASELLKRIALERSYSSPSNKPKQAKQKSKREKT